MDMIDGSRLEKLRRCADEARAAHYGRYSTFMVLAAVEAKDGKVYSGSNVEIVNYSLTKHAEEVAILVAIRGEQDPKKPWLRALYVAGGPPCGSCRQFALEFALDDAICLIEEVDQEELKAQPLANRTNPLVGRLLSDLLPDAFGPKDVPGCEQR